VSALVIAGREFRSLFTTAVAWLVLVGTSFLAGYFWLWVFFNYAAASTDLVYDPYASAQLDLGDHLLAPWFGDMAIVLVMVSPALSMRSFAEELKLRTLELLLTSPVRTGEIVLGKFLGLLGFSVVMLLASALGPATLGWFGDPDPGVIASGFTGLFLLSAALISMGLFFSSLTENQLVALVLSFAAGLALFILGMYDLDNPDGLLARLALTGHLDGFFTGAVRLSDLVYFASFVGLLLFATWQRVERWRWP
jgi:ABC-2 type transport system permease protein